jgi:hypothetical protein
MDERLLCASCLAKLVTTSSSGKLGFLSFSAAPAGAAFELRVTGAGLAFSGALLCGFGVDASAAVVIVAAAYVSPTAVLCRVPASARAGGAPLQLRVSINGLEWSGRADGAARRAAQPARRRAGQRVGALAAAAVGRGRLRRRRAGRALRRVAALPLPQPRAAGGRRRGGLARLARRARRGRGCRGRAALPGAALGHPAPRRAAPRRAAPRRAAPRRATLLLFPPPRRAAGGVARHRPGLRLDARAARAARRAQGGLPRGRHRTDVRVLSQGAVDSQGLACRFARAATNASLAATVQLAPALLSEPSPASSSACRPPSPTPTARRSRSR